VLAAEDCKRALKFEPRNQDCLQELQKAGASFFLSFSVSADEESSACARSRRTAARCCTRTLTTSAPISSCAGLARTTRNTVPLLSIYLSFSFVFL
jgi:hypothetical protein